jgi:hypothetical protein
MTRVQLNANGAIPLADTVLGTAGSVTGPERVGAQSAVGATNANTPNTMVKRDGSGNFSAGTITATATAANALNGGTTDGDKLHALGALTGGNLSSDTALVATATALMTVTVPATGVYMVDFAMQAQFSVGANTNCFAEAMLQDTTGAVNIRGGRVGSFVQTGSPEYAQVSGCFATNLVAGHVLTLYGYGTAGAATAKALTTISAVPCSWIHIARIG